MHCRPSDSAATHSGHRQRGAALIVAMLIFALAASLVVAMRSEFNRFYQRSANLLSDEQIQAYLRAGEELGAMILIRDYDEDKAENQPRDDLDEIWNSDEVKQPQPLDDIGWIQGVLEDLQGRFNLNSLAASRVGLIKKESPAAGLPVLTSTEMPSSTRGPAPETDVLSVKRVRCQVAPS